MYTLYRVIQSSSIVFKKAAGETIWSEKCDFFFIFTTFSDLRCFNFDVALLL
jgi:hypothetical protein